MHHLDSLLTECGTVKILTFHMFNIGMGHQRAKDGSCMGGQGASCFTLLSQGTASLVDSLTKL